MSISYNPSTNFSIKDTMGSTNPDKILSGVPFDAEFSAISASFQLAAPTLNPNFTGTVTVDALTASTVNGTVTTTWDNAATTVSNNSAGWTSTKDVVDAGASNWDEAYGWGNHADAGYAGSDTTYTGGSNITINGSSINLDSSLTNLTDVDTASVSLGDWEIKLNGSELVFCYGGVNRVKVTSGGTVVAEGNITAYGSA